MPDTPPQQAVAITGMGCRFPGGANTPEQFWQLLCEGVDAITEIPRDRFDVDALFDPDPAAPGKIYTRWGGYLDGIDEFDADFFGIAPREARRMDPQQRILLEVAWEALEHGGQPPDLLAGTNTGVFVGVAGHDYADVQALPLNRAGIDAHVNVGSSGCIIANRLSYLLDLHGPSFTVDTACSSSLTAVHLACRSLAAGECDLAIAGGVNVLLAPEPTIGFSKANMLSPDGRCRAFDARANGYVRSEGVGAVVLKPLAAALADGDPIQAVIRGSAINQDGRTAGLSLPSAAGQEEMLRRALREAGVPASAIQYVEAHGTGTNAGDPVEAAAIGTVLSSDRPAGEYCLLGSVKSNVGHLEVAAGVAGLIKAALALKNRTIPPNLHFSEPNPAIAFEELKLRVPTQLEPWPETTGPAMAGVNSFGFGGANAHLVLEEPPQPEPPQVTADSAQDQRARAHVLTLSAHALDGLRQSAERHVAHLRAAGSVDVGDLCYSAATRRSHHQYRLAAVFGSQAELHEHLEAFLREEERAGLATGRASSGQEPKLAFVFSGMGPQWWGMGQQLLDEEPTFREVIEECGQILAPLTGWSLMEEVAADETQSRIGETDVAQVVNCAVQIALAAVWRSWGVVPDAIVGHSAGEMAAAHVAGALSLPDALFGAFHRGRLLHRATGTGTMLAAGISEAEAAGLMAEHRGRVSLAAVNSPTSITLSGEAGALEQIADALEAQERFCRLLPVEVPYHGPQMEAIREELLDVLAGLSPASPTVPIVSARTGTWAGAEPFDADYWWRNVRQPVQFAAAIDTLIEDGAELLVEVSPHPVLAGNIAECLANHGTAGDVLPTLRRDEDERPVMLSSLATLYARGRRIDWSGVYPSGSCLTLPTYPWQRERHWFETTDETTEARPVGIDTGHPLLGRRLPSPQPSWEADLEDPRTDYLDAHVVEDSAVFPGAAYVEMALAAGRELWGDTPVTLEHVKFHKLLFLTRPRDLRFQLLYGSRDASVEMHSAPAGEPLSWTLNAAATLRRNEEREADGRIDLAGARKRCTNWTSSEDQYRSLEQRGFRYGGPFRGLQEIWSGEAEAVGRIRFPDGIDLPVDRYRVHPALLDAAFQLFGLPWSKSSVDAHAGRPLFPVSVDRIVVRRSAGPQFWAHMVLRHTGEGLLEGDISLADNDGNVAVACEGLRIKVLEGAQPSQRREIDDWLYELRWEEAPLPELPVPPAPSGDEQMLGLAAPSGISQALTAQRVGPEVASGAQDYYDTVEPSLDRIATGFTLAALDELGWDPHRDSGRPTDVVAEALGVVPAHRRLLAGLLRMVPDPAEGARDGDAAFPQRPAVLHRQLDALVADFPAYAPKAQLVGKTGGHLADILRGDIDAREILLTDDSLKLLAQLYQASPLGRAYHEVVGDAVAAAVGGWAGTAPLRVLEVGAGTGAATAAVLPHLPASAEYVFTDISPHFLTRAEERFGEHPGVRFAVLDIETDPAAQGFEPHAFDLVLAANVLHTTAELRSTVGNAQRLLAPGALLALLELTRPTGWFNLVFGLLDGWWRFADLDLRPAQPLLQAGQWQSLLEESGFEEVTSLFAGERAGGELQTVVLAQAPAAQQPVASSSAAVPARQRRWLLFADTSGVAAELAVALRARGDACTLAYRGEVYRPRDDGGFELPLGDAAAACARLLAELGEDRETLHGVVHLWSLDAGSGDGLSSAELMETQQLGCGSVLALMQALQQAAGRMPEIWLVTSGSQPVPGHDAAPNMPQAALWGLGRVLLNEHAEVRCRLVDLGPALAREEVDALAEELCGDGADEELALRGQHRLVRRLHRAALERTARREERCPLSPDDHEFSLGIEAPGALGSLVLQQVPPVVPGPGKLSIRVVASGVSFRDVLHALGMLPEAVFQYESGPPSLGSECAGIVVACGEGVDGFQVGDEVIALASATHGSRAIARADLAVPKPSSLSFEAAACIPNAYVTVDYALNHVARVTAGERVLIHSAAGAVGLAAIAYCRRAGAEVYATAGTPDKRAYLRSLGIEHVMDSRSLAFADEILEQTGGEGVDVVLNSLAGEALLKGVEVLRPYGRFVELGKRDIYENAQLGLLPFQRNLSFHAIDLVQLALDRPAVAQSLLADIVREVADGALPMIPHTAFDLAEAEQAFRLIAQAKHIGKVVLTVRAPRYHVGTGREVPVARADGTYLITGGLGGFGLAVAEWLAHQGAQHLVLVSRSGTPKEDAAALAGLRESGAEVVVMPADVSQERDVARVLDSIQRDLPPLRGIVHAAMVLDDDVLVRLDRKRFDAVLAPKVAGAWNLHRLTRHHQLDFFAMFSSMASVIGHPLQANYAAANAFLDSLAAHRRALDLPALTIGWGAVSDVGYVARHPETAAYLDRGGFTTFSPQQALETLEELLRYDLTHVIAARMDWSRWAASNSLTAASKRFEPFVPAMQQDTQERAEGASGSPLSLLESAAGAERRELLVGYVLQKVAKVIGTTPEKIDPERELAQLGFDSLMAVELVTALKADLAVSIPVVKILGGTSGVQLADALLDQLDFDAPDAAAPVAPPARDERLEDSARHPLSFEQRRFWFLQRLDPEDAAYNLPAAARLSGALDHDALQRGLSEILRRHDLLRATVDEVDGEPVQRFGPAAPAELPLVDLADLPEAERDERLGRLAIDEIQRPFDFDTGPLLRARLFRLEAEEHLLLLVVHHIACDAWAVNLVMRELAALYEAFTRGEPSPLAEPTLGYPDYVGHQQQRLAEVGDSQLAYWRRQLAGASPALQLSDSPAEPTAGKTHGAHHPFELTAQLTAELEALANREGVTLFVTLMAAFQTLLHRYADAEDVCVGTAVSTRDEPGFEAVVGCFINTVVLRSDLSGEPTFRELLQRVKATTLEAFTHRDVPFEQVVEALDPERGTGRNPLFEAMLVLHNARWPELRVAGLDVRPEVVESGTAVADLVLLLDTGDRLGGMLEYNADRFDTATVDRLLGHFRGVLEAVVSDPDQRLSSLPLLSKAERQRVLVEWNDTDVDFGPQACLHHLVEAQVSGSPDAVAAVFEGAGLSYTELDERANRLARHLRARGVGPQAVVGVCLPRSLELVVAALAVLKAGAAYLPLDPALPTERLRFLLADAQPGALLTRQSLLDRLPEAGVSVVTLDAEGLEIARQSPDKPDDATTPDDLAYVIYTSGSSGQPKGVMVPHRAICNQVRWRQHAFPLSEADAVLQRTPLGFDPSIWELFGPLASGARLVIPPQETEREGGRLVRLLADQRVTTLQVVPSVLDALLEQPGIDDCGDLRLVFCGGEPLTPDLADRALARLPAALHHLYGPSEAAIDATHWACRAREDQRLVPIGRPIANARVLILDDERQAVPVGVPGELHIGGAGLARGYHNRPDLTAERFIQDPFSAGERLYRTGDLGRWLPDGSIAFLGRVDRQVKVRGLRVEPGEIEAVLTGHAAVREAAVVAVEDPLGTRQLATFAVVDQPATASELRDHAAEHLPEHMVPAALTLLDALPRTASGKVDHARLAAQAEAVPERRSAPVLPRDAVEGELSRIWEGFFPGRRVGVTDDFFALGGHSLLAMRVIAGVERAFGRELPVSTLLESRTIERLACVVREQAQPRSPLVTIQPHGTAPPFYWVHPVSGTVYCYAELAAALGEQRPLYGLEAAGLSGGEPHRRIEDMAGHYIEELARAHGAGPYLLGGWSMGGLIAFEMARQLEERGEQVALLTVVDTAPPALDEDAAHVDEAAALHGFVEHLGVTLDDLAVSVDDFWDLSREEQLTCVLEHARRAHLVPPDLELPGLHRHLQVFTTNLQAVRSYAPSPYAGRVTLLDAEESLGHTAGHAARWGELALGGVTRHTVAGNHHTVLRQPHVVALARQLSACLAEMEFVPS